MLSDDNNSAVAVRDLVKQFAGRDILSGISLDVKHGDVCAVIGPSGGGKTTFLRCLNGLEDFQAGAVRLAGMTLTADLPQRDRKSHSGAHSPSRGDGLSAIQLVSAPHGTRQRDRGANSRAGARSPARIDDARSLLERVGLADKLDHMPDMLSGGQQQRVAIARALAMKPEVMLFDEPTSALDPRMATEVEAVIADLASSGQTMIVVTHSLRLARRTAKTVQVFDGGHVLESGPTDQVFGALRTS